MNLGNYYRSCEFSKMRVVWEGRGDGNSLDIPNLPLLTSVLKIFLGLCNPVTIFFSLLFSSSPSSSSLPFSSFSEAGSLRALWPVKSGNVLLCCKYLAIPTPKHSQHFFLSVSLWKLSGLSVCVNFGSRMPQNDSDLHSPSMSFLP